MTAERQGDWKMTDLEELYRQILKGKEVRKNLIAIRQGLEDETARRKFMYFLGAEFDPLTGLLGNEDPKVRRNAALILEKETSEAEMRGKQEDGVCRVCNFKVP